MVLTAKRAAEICREWYVEFRNNGKGEEKCVLAQQYADVYRCDEQDGDE